MAQANVQSESLPTDLLQRVRAARGEWESQENLRRLWNADESLWTSSGETDWLGWLDVIEQQQSALPALEEFAASVRGRYSHAVLLGMGGSSLCPEVLRLCFGPQEGFPDFGILDSTDPDQIRACEDSVNLESTLFIAASKSGSTLETSLLTQHFLQRLSGRLGRRRAARRFVAVTDPGSRLEDFAREAGFRNVLHGVPTIGGRYSALSNFGMAPAAAMGLDVGRLLAGAGVMQVACGPDSGWDSNPGLRLGILMGAAAIAGRDKLTLATSPPLDSLGTWVEQLIAESTGKQGKGIVPVEGEALGSGATYGKDRLFVHTSLASRPDPGAEAALADLVRHGHPVARIRVAQLEDIGQEFFRWEVATAVAGAVIGINPFDQPDVESAKVAARQLAAEYESSGVLPSEPPFYENAGVQLFADPRHARRLTEGLAPVDLPAVLRAHLGSAGAGDYVALLAFVSRNRESETALARMRAALQPMGVASCVGFGPRFLHSTGQLHKGGPDTGVFVQIGCANAPDIPAPGREISFGAVKDAQALGDFQVLARQGRRALRVQLLGDLATGLARLESAFAEAVQ